MDLNEAKDAWISLTAKVKPECLSDLIEFINGTVEDMDVIDESTAEALKKLNKISGFIRDKVGKHYYTVFGYCYSITAYGYSNTFNF